MYNKAFTDILSISILNLQSMTYGLELVRIVYIAHFHETFGQNLLP